MEARIIWRTRVKLLPPERVSAPPARDTCLPFDSAPARPGLFSARNVDCVQGGGKRRDGIEPNRACRARASILHQGPRLTARRKRRRVQPITFRGRGHAKARYAAKFQRPAANCDDSPPPRRRTSKVLSEGLPAKLSSAPNTRTCSESESALRSIRTYASRPRRDQLPLKSEASTGCHPPGHEPT
jgi:hypothetical protein